MEYLLVLLAVVVVLSIIVPKKNSRYTSRWKRANKEIGQTSQNQKPAKLSCEKNDQLSITLNNKYEKQRLINKTEEEVYKIILRMIYQHAKGQYKINMQTSLGETLKSSYEGHRTINSKRVDFCIVDRDFMPVAVVEVNGAGHYQGDALIREETKRAAIESAGIKYIAIRENENAIEKLNRELKIVLSSSQEQFLG